MRFFIALEIPEESKKELLSVQHMIRQLVPDARLTDNDKLHLTIAFVGEQPEELRSKLIDMINERISGLPSFTVTPAYIDGFPALHQARVLWVGIKGDIDKLFILREKVKDGLIDLNLDVDERRFIPHIAVAKLKDFEINPFIEDRFQKMMTQPFAPISVSSIKLFESIPNHGFHRHNTLAEIKLVEEQTLS